MRYDRTRKNFDRHLNYSLADLQRLRHVAQRRETRRRFPSSRGRVVPTCIEEAARDELPGRGRHAAPPRPDEAPNDAGWSTVGHAIAAGSWQVLRSTMPHMNANGIDLYYEVHGEGVPILGIHGSPSSALLWVNAARELADRGRCIIYDRRGFFRSQRPEPFETVDLTDHVDDAAALLDALSATPAIVIGRSTGGEIALALAHRFPDKVKALVLLEPAVFTVDPQAAAWADRLRRKVLQAAAENPSSAAEAVFREALGGQAWESFPQELRELFAGASPRF